jgi:hypothetical protein
LVSTTASPLVFEVDGGPPSCVTMVRVAFGGTMIEGIADVEPLLQGRPRADAGQTGAALGPCTW